MKKITLLLVVLALQISCVAVNPKAAPPKKIHGKAGRPLPYFSLTIDSNYEPQLDHVVKGYKLLPVVMKNFALKAVPMDLKNDRWVVVGEKGQTYKALNSLKLKDPVAWRKLPEDVKNLIDYPEILPIEYSVTFDILLPSNAKLDYFRELRFYSSALGREFVIEKEY
ncbi:MAG: hypothetical protein IPJ69_11965 [Deltaproteobacteria bacterium]|nr:MAG: hypothetical protein IPJ69_11965 [Deltaproteobacteria bacterium]